MANAPNHSSASLQGDERGRKRATRIIIIASVVLLLMLSLIAQGGFNLSPFLSPETAGETLLLYALSTLNFFAFITLLFVLLRNIIKLGRERRAGVAGSRFKARLVFYTIGLSLLPVALMFFFAYGLLNRSVDRWFGDPARQIVEDAKYLQDDYYRKEEEDLASDTRTIARTLSLLSRSKFNDAALGQQLKQELSSYNLALIRIIAPGERLTIQDDADPAAQTKLANKLNKIEFRLTNKTPATTDRDEFDDTKEIYFLSGMRISNAPEENRLMIVARKFPPEISPRLANISEQHNNFYALRDKVRRIKATYMLLLAAVALLLVFSASWLALYVARGITVPIQSLVEATQRIAKGDFEHPVNTLAEDELAALVTSFNRMAGIIAENRRQLEHAAEELQQTNQALDDRRRYIETVLESLSTGVISLDAKAGVTTINDAAITILGIKEKPEIGKPIEELSRQGEEIARLCRRAWRSDVAQSEIAFARPDGSAIFTATTAIVLRRSKGSVEGWVVVIEDLSNLIQAERAAAWSEVARRMAHEIKNPLTPIQLSAERILRNYRRGNGEGAEARFGEIVREGTATIVREVAALQRMVEEFSRFARLPEARPVEASLNEVVRDALSLYAERLPEIHIEDRLGDNLPVMRFDTEQIKRVIVNLVDNAIEAIDSNGIRENGGGAKRIDIETVYDDKTEMARLTVSDTGHGIRPADRDKLFLPKFSTRERGTGLGLAIVSHIIADHKGRIRVEDNIPHGARFIVELPASQLEANHSDTHQSGDATSNGKHQYQSCQ